jgi:hypothetical protein
MHAISANDWTNPYGSENSFDRFAGGGSSGQPWARGIGRTVGTLAAILTGGGALSGGESGASEVGSGFPLSEEAGGAGPEGQLSGPSGSGASNLTDYLRRYGRQLMNLTSRMQRGQQQQTQVGDGIYGGLIPPMVQPDPFAETQQLPPGLMALLIANAMQQQQQAHGDGSSINDGGVI